MSSGGADVHLEARSSNQAAPKAEEGKALLIYGHDWGNFEASYYTCKDQRICFRVGWLQFATQHNIGDGSVVLILFHNDHDSRLIVSFDAL